MISYEWGALRKVPKNTFNHTINWAQNISFGVMSPFTIGRFTPLTAICFINIREPRMYAENNEKLKTVHYNAVYHWSNIILDEIIKLIMKRDEQIWMLQNWTNSWKIKVVIRVLYIRSSTSKNVSLRIRSACPSSRFNVVFVL